MYVVLYRGVCRSGSMFEDHQGVFAVKALETQVWRENPTANNTQTEVSTIYCNPMNLSKQVWGVWGV